MELPVRELHPYCSRDYPSNCPTVTVERVLFELEYVFDKDKHFLNKHHKQADLFYTRGSPMDLLQTELTLPSPVAVLKRTDEFYRW